MYVADFACIEAKLVVEVDGSQHQEHRAYDLKREEYLTECGFQVLRFWDNEVLAQTDAVLETISRVLTSRRPHPSLPPQAGEGS
jgi:very-short-patch-repair endonuclease